MEQNNNNKNILKIKLTSVNVSEQQSGNNFEIEIDLYVEREINKSDFINYVKEEKNNDFRAFILNEIITDDNLSIDDLIDEDFYDIFSKKNYYDVENIDYNLNDESEATLLIWEEEAEAILNEVNKVNNG